MQRARRLVVDVPGLVTDTYAQWRDHRTIRLGAGLAYYGLFAFVPLIAVSLSLAGLFFATDDVQSYLADQFASIFTTDASELSAAVAAVLDDVGIGLGVIGLGSLLFTASVLVIALQDALNTIWDRPVRFGIKHSVVRRGVAFLVVFAAGAVLILSFAVNAISGLLAQLVPDFALVAPLSELFGTAFSWVLGIGVIALLFRYLTDVRVPWVPVLIGSALTALFVAIGTVAIGAYLRRYAASSLVGATGSVFLVLIWIYYEAQIILAGAVFTRTVAERRTALDEPTQSTTG